MDEVKLVVRTADLTRKAEVTLSRNATGGDVVQSAVQRWSLPTDSDYRLMNVTRNQSLLLAEPLRADAVRDGDLLELQPLIVAGARA